jgi:hypothetical protein
MTGRALVSLAIGVITWAAASPARGQGSASYRLSDYAINAGGHPMAGTAMASTHFRISLDAIGDPAGQSTSSPSFQIVPGLAGSHPPPGEVKNLQFAADAKSMSWDVEPAAGVYELYRDLVSALHSGSAGVCLQGGLQANAATDLQVPASGYFYLVTSRNSLGEEGTKGYASSGAERPNPLPCP